MGSKICKGCGAEKPLDEFFKHPETLDGRTGKCKACKYARQKERVREDGDKAHKRYRKTPRGYLTLTYSNMRGRVLGRIEKSVHLYKGLDILTREEFNIWAFKDSTFTDMLAVYEANDYDQRFAPSIDRIDTQQGYVIGNIRWLTHSQNSSLGGQNK